MGSFAGNKPKDTYQQVLKLESDGVTTTPKTVEDGAGNDTALQVASDKVKINGNLLVENMTDSSSLTNSLVWNSSTKAIERRALAENAFADEAIVYDSGWKNVPDYSAGTGSGIFNADGHTAIRFRVLDRQVIFSGTLLIPLADSTGGTIDDSTTYRTTYQTGVAQTGTGFTVLGSKNVRTVPIFESSALQPDGAQIFTIFKGSRRINSIGNTAQLLHQAVLNIQVDASGRFVFICLNDAEIPDSSPTTEVKHDPYRIMCTKVEASDYNLDWTNYKSSADATGGLNNTYAKGAYQYPVDFDGADGTYWGGMEINLDGVYFVISNSVPIADIKAAADAI